VGLGRATQTGPQHDLLQRMFQEIFDDLSHQYLVGYQPTNQKRDGAWRKIRVEVGEDYTVRHRQGYRLLPER
jgi:hypothetical protein